jgi:endo-1,4-beta-xylanase
LTPVNRRAISLLVVLAAAFLAMPPQAATYGGREPGAGWREQANRRIEANRKADFTIVVSNKDGDAVEGAQIRAKMVRHAFAFGAAIGATRLMGKGDDAERYRKVVASRFNKVVLENDLKWDQWVQSKSNPPGSKYFYPQTLAALEWLKHKNILVRGHYLGWGPVEQLDAYKKHQGGSAAFRGALFNHIREKVSRVDDLVAEWDAVNHPIGWHDRLITLGSLFGPGIYADVFKLARELNPKARLYINEGSLLPTARYNESVRDKYAQLIRFLLDNGAPLGGIGFMGHFDHDKLTPPSELIRILDRFSAFGLPLQITEFDIRFGERGKPYNFSEKELQLQADYTRDFMTAAFSHPAIEGIVMWGFWEGHHYNPSAALYRTDWSAKPNGKVWEDLVFRQWWTDVRGQTDRAGNFKTRGFLGEYEITVEHQGKTITRSARLPKGGNRINFVIE